jgi:hypothetical protein
MLLKTENCPVCNGESIEQVKGFLLMPEGGWVYTSKILKKNREDTLKITEAMQAHQCLVCGSYFYSPWFSGPDASDAFTTDVSRHQHGWLNLQHVLTSKYPNSVQRLNVLVLEALCGESPVMRYGEIGCPYQGLNILNFSIKNPSSYKRIVEFWKASLKRTDPRNSLAIRLADFSKNLGVLLSGWTMLMESVLRSFFKSGAHRYPESSSLSKTEKYFLTTTTSYGWGSACEGFGVPCQKLASQLLGVKVVPLWDLKQEGFFDLIGIFNFFDHLSNSLQVLDRALFLARNVVITVHRKEYAGKQHRVIIGTDFIDFLKNRYSGHYVKLLKESGLDSFSGADQYNVFVLKRKS